MNTEDIRGRHYLSRAKRIHYTVRTKGMDMADISEAYLLYSDDAGIEIRKGISDPSYIHISSTAVK